MMIAKMKITMMMIKPFDNYFDNDDDNENDYDDDDDLQACPPICLFTRAVSWSRQGFSKPTFGNNNNIDFDHFRAKMEWYNFSEINFFQRILKCCFL